MRSGGSPILVDSVLDILGAHLDAKRLRVPGRDETCPVCETSAWYGLRHFEGEEPTYWLCKWCGFRWTIAKGIEAGTLALPVYHDCHERRLLTWHQVEPGEEYLTKQWKCDCGEKLYLHKTLRPSHAFLRTFP